MSRIVFLVLICVLSIFQNVFSQSYNDSSRVLNIGIKEAKPFTIKNADGTWSGISTELWQLIATKTGMRYNFIELGLTESLQKLDSHQLDAAVGAFTINAEREGRVNFSQAYFASGLGVAYKNKSLGLLGFIKSFFTPSLWRVIGVLCFIIFAFGFAIWLFERKANSEQFSEKPLKGIGSGFWWSAVTMTTVGYGDKSPVTFGGRIIGLIWMFVALIIISSFTAAIASALTVNQIQKPVESPAELGNVRVGAVANTTGVIYLEKRRIKYNAYSNLDEAISALSRGELDAVVSDYPLLSFYINDKPELNLKMLPHRFAQFFYGIPLSTDFEQREILNRSLLEITESDNWQDIIYRYLGEDS